MPQRGPPVSFAILYRRKDGVQGIFLWLMFERERERGKEDKESGGRKRDVKEESGGRMRKGEGEGRQERMIKTEVRRGGNGGKPMFTHNHIWLQILISVKCIWFALFYIPHIEKVIFPQKQTNINFL